MVCIMIIAGAVGREQGANAGAMVRAEHYELQARVPGHSVLITTSPLTYACVHGERCLGCWPGCSTDLQTRSDRIRDRVQQVNP
jgi:hypothetical protein